MTDPKTETTFFPSSLPDLILWMAGWIQRAQQAEAEVAACRARHEARPRWQPIETAPTDGTVVLIAWDFSPSWTPEAARFKHGEWFHDGDTGSAFDTPTHWHPLPAWIGRTEVRS